MENFFEIHINFSIREEKLLKNPVERQKWGVNKTLTFQILVIYLGITPKVIWLET